MINKTFLRWIVYALLGLVVLSLVPEKPRGWLILLLLLGGAVFLSRNDKVKGGLQNFLQEVGISEGEEF